MRSVGTVYRAAGLLRHYAGAVSVRVTSGSPDIDHMSAGLIAEEANVTYMTFGHRVWRRLESVAVPMCEQVIKTIVVTVETRHCHRLPTKF